MVVKPLSVLFEGTGIAYIVNEEVGTLGGFFVKPEYRYQGIGQKIWDARMRYLGDRNVMVNVFSKRADKNVRLGFTHLMEEMTMYIGVPNSREYNEEEFKQDVDRFISIQDANFDELMAYDSGISKQGNRGHYLKTLIQKYKIRGYVAYKDGAVVGYIGEMPSDEMFMIVPLYSQSASVAKALLKKCISELPDGFPVYLLSPNSNDNVGVLVREIGLEKEDGTKCLLSRNSYEVDWGNVYSVLSPVTFIC